MNILCRVLTVVAVLAFGVGAVPAAASEPDPAEVEAFLTERMRDNRAPGMSYALVHRDRVVAAAAWGTDGAGNPMTPRTPVGFGSVSKPLTATAVLRLVDSGAVTLDEPVRGYLPWFRLADRAGADRITVRHLLEQTSGISGRDGFALSDRDDNAPGGIRRWVGDLASVRPTAAPGQRHQYSPANAMILAAIVEQVSGLTFAEYLRSEVFGPLEMTGGIADYAAARRMPPGHEFYFGTVRTAPWTFDTSGVPYGYAAGNVHDLAHLAMTQVNAGRYGTERFLSEQAVASMQRGGPAAAGGRYGLGWRADTLDQTGDRIIWHAGAVTGYHSVVIAAPDSGWAIAVQQNVWSPLRDRALNSAAFGALTIVLGGTPDAVPSAATETIALVTLGATVLGMAVAVALGVRRLAGRRRAVWRGWPTVAAAVAWVAGGLLVAGSVGLVLPWMFGLELRHLVRFTPDIGQLAVVAVVLGVVLAVVRLAVLVRCRAAAR